MIDPDENEPLFSRDELAALTEYQADRVLALLRPDPRIAAIEALLSDMDAEESSWISGEDVRAIIRGEQ